MGPFKLVLASLAAGAMSFGAVVLLFDTGIIGSSTQGRRSDASSISSGPTRCEVEFPAERCRTQPTFKGMDARGVYLDTYEGADKNVERCMRRAADYKNWCQSTQPVTARFYRGGVVMQTSTQQ